MKTLRECQVLTRECDPVREIRLRLVGSERESVLAQLPLASCRAFIPSLPSSPAVRVGERKGEWVRRQLGSCDCGCLLRFSKVHEIQRKLANIIFPSVSAISKWLPSLNKGRQVIASTCHLPKHLKWSNYYPVTTLLSRKTSTDPIS
jgi:hypothetical protein